jgi:hypothetical protein
MLPTPVEQDLCPDLMLETTVEQDLSSEEMPVFGNGYEEPSPYGFFCNDLEDFWPPWDFEVPYHYPRDLSISICLLHLPLSALAGIGLRLTQAEGVRRARRGYTFSR